MDLLARKNVNNRRMNHEISPEEAWVQARFDVFFEFHRIEIESKTNWKKREIWKCHQFDVATRDKTGEWVSTNETAPIPRSRSASAQDSQQSPFHARARNTMSHSNGVRCYFATNKFQSLGFELWLRKWLRKMAKTVRKWLCPTAK